MDAKIAEIVARFGLEPHPEGGFFREVYRSALTVSHPAIPGSGPKERQAGTLIYFLLGRGDFSAFHRVRWTDEIWHLYAGGPLELHLLDPRGGHSLRTLTSDLGGEPVSVVPAGWWQAARLGSHSAWAFGGCTVSPGFDFADFEMPPRAVMLEQYPAHAELVTALTRA